MSTRVTTKSYGSKIGDSLKGVVGGFFAIIIAIGILWFNESNSVKEIRKIAEGKKNTISVESATLSPENDGLLVHMTGKAETKDTLTDEEFGFEVNGVKFIKTVEMYQYKENKKTETKDNVGGNSTTTETFTYEKMWSESLINSDGFYESNKKNPKGFNHKSNVYIAQNVSLGAYNLSSGLISQITSAEDYPISTEMYNPEDEHSSMVQSGMIYFGSGSKNPEIGDERISYKVVYPQDISIVSQQKGNSFIPYVTKNGRTIELTYAGIKTAEEMFSSEAQRNKIFTWVLRLVGFILMFIGFAAILKPISTVGSVLPILGNVLEVGTGLIAGLLAFVISFVVIAVAWIFFRPVLGIILLAVAGGAFFYGKKMFTKKEVAEVKPAVEETKIKEDDRYQK